MATQAMSAEGARVIWIPPPAYYAAGLVGVECDIPVRAQPAAQRGFAGAGVAGEPHQGHGVSVGVPFGGVSRAAATVSTYQRWKRSGGQPRRRTSQS